MLEVPCLSGNGVMVRIRLVFPGVPTDRGPAPINSITPVNHRLAAEELEARRDCCLIRLKRCAGW